MPQHADFTNPTTDFEAILEMIRTQLRLGILHEELADEIEQCVSEIMLEQQDYGPDGEFYGLEDLFEEAEDQEFFVQVLRNSFVVHTTWDELWNVNTAKVVLEMTI